MKRLIAYYLDGKYDEFSRKLKEENFEVVTVTNELQVHSLGQSGNLDLGFFDNGYFFVNPPQRMGGEEIAKRSRLLKIADDFREVNLSLIDRHMTP